MKVRMTWPELCRSARFARQWVALDNCRYDPVTHQPIEGDVVEAHEDLAELCQHMREAGHSSCAILFCEPEQPIETRRSQPPSAPPLRPSLAR